MKREVQPQHLPHLVTARSQHTCTYTVKGVLTIDILLLNPRTVRKQPTGVQKKNLVSKMLTICSLSEPCEQKGLQATGISKKIVSILLTICSLLFGNAGPCGTFLFMFIIGPYGRDQMILEKFIKYLDSAWIC
jgi:hypothetical protein